MYTQEDFQRELSDILSPILTESVMEKKYPLAEAAHIFRTAGKLIIKGQEYLTQEELWATFEQVGIARQEAFGWMNDFLESIPSAEEESHRLYQRELLERIRALNKEIEAGTLTDDIITQKLAAINKEHLELCKKMDKVPLPRMARAAGYEHRFEEMHRETMKQIIDGTWESDEEDEDEE